MQLGGRGRRRSKTAAIVLASLALALPAAAYEPVLHEFIAPDPREDIALAVTTPDGDMPASIDTPSGIVAAPDTQRLPSRTGKAYGGAATQSGPDATYRPDRDTRRPDVVGYEDPFSPSISPYKRLRAFDSVSADYTLKVRDPSLRRVPVTGALLEGEESFYGDLTVDLEPGEPVRVPSVGPGMRVLRLHTTPETGVELYRDGADNLFAKSPERTRVRLVMQVAIARSTFGTSLGATSWSELPATAQLPPNAARSAAHVADAIGISRDMTPREVVGRLVSYFRAFAPSNDAPKGQDDIYLDLALSRKGVCRHRAFAFLVTALGLHIPARMVVNEAHAWVEVGDVRGWHRVDLGGAARNLEEPPPDGRPAYAPPPDPFPWPSSDTGSGQDLADRSRRNRPQPDATQEHASSGADAGSGAQSRSPSGSQSPSRSPSESGSGSGSGSERDERPPAHVVLAASDADSHRGMPVRVKGAIDADGSPCSHVRVDVQLVSARSGLPIPIGSLASDEAGRFEGAVVMPVDVPVGDYELSISTPGDTRCGPGRGQ